MGDWLGVAVPVPFFGSTCGCPFLKSQSGHCPIWRNGQPIDPKGGSSLRLTLKKSLCYRVFSSIEENGEGLHAA